LEIHPLDHGSAPVSKFDTSVGQNGCHFLTVAIVGSVLDQIESIIIIFLSHDPMTRPIEAFGFGKVDRFGP
jgi:hypothetical protein